MEFVKYQHIERFGTDETQGIDIGECYIMPKVDGTNGQLFIDDSGKLCAGSRNRQLTLEKDNAGFYKWALDQDNIQLFFAKHPNLRLYGEFLVKHAIADYEDSAWRKFYVFDVVRENGEYIRYEDYKVLLDEFNIEYIPPMCKIKNPTYERLLSLLDKNTYLMKNGAGVGEGLVLRNYDYTNKYGRKTWAKIVRNEFKTLHTKSNNILELKEKQIIEQEIVDLYITEKLINKEKSKIVTVCNGWSSKYIPRLLETVYHCLITEEIWNIIKKFKKPVIDFKRLRTLTVLKIKEIKKELF